MPEPPDLTGVAELLGQPVRPEVAEFFGSFLAGPVESRHSGEVVLLRTLWNRLEVSQLASQLLTHLRGQLQGGHPPTIPVASSDSDLFFAVDNANGKVVLQEAGYPPSRVVATTLEEFLNAL
jgi:SecY interacting protein Syd